MSDEFKAYFYEHFSLFLRKFLLGILSSIQASANIGFVRDRSSFYPEEFMMIQAEIDPIQRAHQTFFFLTNILFPKKFSLRSHIPTTVKAHAGFLGWGMEGDPLKSGSPSPSIGLMSIPEPPPYFPGILFHSIQSREAKKWRWGFPAFSLYLSKVRC